MQLELTINGKAVSADIPPNTLLSAFIREHLQMTGTHRGCDTSQCGACTVLADGHAVKSCNVVVGQMQGAEITTIEGISEPGGELHPMQAAFKECHGLQCGFCTPGMIMSSIDLLNNHPHATQAEIREQLEGNICRCTGYTNIIKAVQTAQKEMAA